MKHAVDGGKCGADALEIRDIGLDELRTLRNVFPLSGREVVEHPDAGTAGDERFRDVGADESRAACNKVEFHRVEDPGRTAAASLAPIAVHLDARTFRDLPEIIDRAL